MTSDEKSQPVRGPLGRLVVTLRAAPLWTPRKLAARYLSAALIFLLAAGSIAHVAVAQGNALPAGAVFRVGDTVCTEQELAQRIKLLQVLYGVQPPTDPRKEVKFRRAAAKAVAVSDILEGAKLRHGVVIADKQASDQLDKVVQKSTPQGGRQQFLAALGKRGISERQVLDEIKRQLGDGQLFEKITHNVATATEADARKAYDQHRAEMAQPEQRHLRNIVTDSQDTANQARQRIRSGENFAVVAREVSIDASTKNNGGDLGFLGRDHLESDYAKTAFTTAPQGLFGPVHTAHGWNVGQVLEVKPAVPLSFEQVKATLSKQLSTKRRLDAWNRWLAEQIHSADVQYADRYRPANPDAPPSAGPPR